VEGDSTMNLVRDLNDVFEQQSPDPISSEKRTLRSVTVMSNARKVKIQLKNKAKL